MDERERVCGICYGDDYYNSDTSRTSRRSSRVFLLEKRDASERIILSSDDASQRACPIVPCPLHIRVRVCARRSDVFTDGFLYSS